MQDIFSIAANVSTPLALGGFFAAILFFIFRQILQMEIIPALAKSDGAEIIKTVVDRLFVLALIAMFLGFVGYMIPPKRSFHDDAQVKKQKKTNNGSVNDSKISSNNKTVHNKSSENKNIGQHAYILKKRVNSPSFGNVDGDITIDYSQVNKDEKDNK